MNGKDPPANERLENVNVRSDATPAIAPTTLDGASTKGLLSGSRLLLRLALLTLLVVSLLTGLLMLLVDQVFSNLTPSLRDDLRWKAETGVSELSQSADLALLTKDKAQLKAATDRYANEGDFLYVSFRDSTEQLVYERGVATKLPSVERSRGAISESDDAFAAWAPMEVEGLAVGEVILVVSKQRLRSGTQLYQRIVLAGFLGAAVALSLALLFARFYIAPILRLTERSFVELERTADMALASARARSQFLANMSHEIRTPMNGMFGMLHLVQQTRLTDDQRRYMDLMAASAKSLLNIVNDVLDFSKLDANKYRLAPEACDLNEVFTQTINLFEAKANEKGLQVKLTLHDSVPRIAVVDADRLRQVLSNLLSNAIKFTPQGGVYISVNSAPGQAKEGDSSGSCLLTVNVRDTGIGVSESARTQLFSAFAQGDTSSSRSHEGTGLGLAICRKLIELMGGVIEYEGSPDGGSTFRFTIPILSSSSGEMPATAPVFDSNTKFQSDLPVLLVDDNEINQLVAVEILENMGLEVDVAGGGQEAIDATLAGNYALVLMDCQMPEVDGYRAAREIRSKETGRRLPIVAFTAHAFEEERVRILACGMDDFIAKPIEPEALQRVLARYLPTVTRETARESFTGSTPKGSASPKPAVKPEPSVQASEAELEGIPALKSDLPRPQRAVELFLETVPKQIELLRHAAERGDAEDVRTLAHKLKGSSGSMGAARLSKLCDFLQKAAPNADAKTALEHVKRIEEAHKVAHGLLQLEYERSNVEAKSETNPKTDAPRGGSYNPGRAV
ncbi:MAG TPA: ATP-binding protein [Polyangiaceae bacterium]|jgi:signal transduction histidine kinase/DNA-binding NarL/FixJ family response regulator|nr:ATP-binding protein [Polyangiaceae bacterium]